MCQFKLSKYFRLILAIIFFTTYLHVPSSQALSPVDNSDSVDTSTLAPESLLARHEAKVNAMQIMNAPIGFQGDLMIDDPESDDAEPKVIPSEPNDKDDSKKKAKAPASRVEEVAQGLPYDLNSDNELNASDIDELYGAIHAGSEDLKYDLNDDGIVNNDDMTFFIHDIFRTEFGDANLDGSVSLGDLSALGANWQQEAGWAGGDFNGDGFVNLSDLSIYGANQGFVSPDFHDFNSDDILDASDIDSLYRVIGSGTTNLSYDLNGDGVVNHGDMEFLIHDVFETVYGDADLDGDVDFDDYQILSEHIGQEGGWGQGDFNESGDIDVADVLILQSNFGFVRLQAPEISPPSINEPFEVGEEISIFFDIYVEDPVGASLNIYLAGDLDHNGTVEPGEITQAIGLIGVTQDDFNFNPELDLNHNGIIDDEDIQGALLMLGKTIPASMLIDDDTLYWTATDGFIGDMHLVLVAEDSRGKVGTQPFQLAIITRQQVPQISPILINDSVEVGTNMSIPINITDEDPESVLLNVYLAGDLNHDGIVEQIEFVTAAALIGVVEGHSDFNPELDLDKNGVIDDNDIQRVLSMIGRSIPDDLEVSNDAISWTPTNDYLGTMYFVIVAEDNAGAVGTQTFQLTVVEQQEVATEFQTDPYPSITLNPTLFLTGIKPLGSRIFINGTEIRVQEVDGGIWGTVWENIQLQIGLNQFLIEAIDNQGDIIGQITAEITYDPDIDEAAIMQIIDTDQNGLISTLEGQDALHAIFNQDLSYDFDNNNVIDQQDREIVYAVIHKNLGSGHDLINEKYTWRAYQYLDGNSDGVVSFEEAAEGTLNFTHSYNNRYHRTVDFDQDFVLNVEDLGALRRYTTQLSQTGRIDTIQWQIFSALTREGTQIMSSSQTLLTLRNAPLHLPLESYQEVITRYLPQAELNVLMANITAHETQLSNLAFDLDHNTLVDVLDYLLADDATFSALALAPLLSNFQKNSFDFNKDGILNYSDLDSLFDHYLPFLNASQYLENISQRLQASFDVNYDMAVSENDFLMIRYAQKVYANRNLSGEPVNELIESIFGGNNGIYLTSYLTTYSDILSDHITRLNLHRIFESFGNLSDILKQSAIESLTSRILDLYRDPDFVLNDRFVAGYLGTLAHYVVESNQSELHQEIRSFIDQELIVQLDGEPESKFQDRRNLMLSFWDHFNIIIYYNGDELSYNELPPDRSGSYTHRMDKLQGWFYTLEANFPPFRENLHILLYDGPSGGGVAMGRNGISVGHDAGIDIYMHETAHIIQRNPNLTDAIDTQYRQLYDESVDEDGDPNSPDTGDFETIYALKNTTSTPHDEGWAELVSEWGFHTNPFLTRALNRAVQGRPILLEKILLLNSLIPQPSDTEWNIYRIYTNTAFGAEVAYNISQITVNKDVHGRVDEVHFNSQIYYITYDANDRVVAVSNVTPTEAASWGEEVAQPISPESHNQLIRDDILEVKTERKEQVKGIRESFKRIKDEIKQLILDKKETSEKTLKRAIKKRIKELRKSLKEQRKKIKEIRKEAKLKIKELRKQLIRT